MDQKNDNGKKVKEATSAFFQKVSEMGKKAADGIQKGAQAVSEKAKADGHDRKMKKYNPLTPEEFKSESFNIPNIIKIVDDADRRDIDFCEGAIGWRGFVKGVEILYLYDEWVKESGIQFFPVQKCNDTYCVDPFDRKLFVQAESIFERTNCEKIAELQNIARCLGAKSCTIKIMEANKINEKNSSEISVKEKGAAIGVSNQSHVMQGVCASGENKTVFKWNNKIVRPQLKWFAHNSTILNLIDQRCSKKGSVKTYFLELKGSSSISMSKKTACAVDKIIKANGAIEKASSRENSSVLIFNVEF